MKHDFLNPPDLYTPPEGMYSLLAKSGTMLHVSGLLPLDQNGNVVGLNDVTVQYRKVWENIHIALKYAGAELRDLIKTSTYIVGRTNIEPVRKIRQELNPNPPPASTLILVAGLANDECLVEVDAVAIIDRTGECH